MEHPAGDGLRLACFDAQHLAPKLDLPAAVVVTKGDLLIRRRRQTELAEALGARVIEVAGRHNAWLVKPDE